MIRKTDIIGAGLKLLIEPLAIFALVPIAFVKWNSSDGITTGTLPKWAKVFDTPNQNLPGDTTIPAVASCLNKRGRYWCSAYWLIGRNRMQGFAFLFAKPLQSPWPLEPGSYTQEPNLWWMRKSIFGGKLQLKRGYAQYVVDGKLWGVPTLTITKP